MAAQSLTMIYPLVNSKGIVMNIPTLGQCTVSQNEIQELEAFVVDADVLFLVTDTRESRWLPSVLGLHHNKVGLPLINNLLFLLAGDNGCNWV